MPIGWERGAGWTIEALKNHFDDLFEAHERLDTARFAAMEQATKVLSGQAQEWRAAANEWRGALNDARSEYLTRDAYERGHQGIIEQVGFLQKQVNDLRGRMTVLLIGLPVAVTAILGLMHVFRKP